MYLELWTATQSADALTISRRHHHVHHTAQAASSVECCHTGLVSKYSWCSTASWHRWCTTIGSSELTYRYPTSPGGPQLFMISSCCKHMLSVRPPEATFRLHRWMKIQQVCCIDRVTKALHWCTALMLHSCRQTCKVLPVYIWLVQLA